MSEKLDKVRELNRDLMDARVAKLRAILLAKEQRVRKAQEDQKEVIESRCAKNRLR
jgi:hypothetical protein